MSCKHTGQLSFAYINCHQLRDPKPTDICMAPYKPFVAALKWRRNGGETAGTVETHDNVQQPFDSNSWYLLQRPIIHSQLNRHSVAGSSPSRQWLRGSGCRNNSNTHPKCQQTWKKLWNAQDGSANDQTESVRAICNILKQLSLHATKPSSTEWRLI